MSDDMELKAIQELNDFLRRRFDLQIVEDDLGWHEVMSRDYFASPWDAFRYTVEYGLDIESGIKSIRYMESASDENVSWQGDEPIPPINDSDDLADYLRGIGFDDVEPL